MKGASFATCSANRWEGCRKFEGTWNAQLPTLAKGGAHPRQQVEVIVHPLEGRVGEDQIEISAEPRADVAHGEGQAGNVTVIGLGVGQHGLRGVDADRLGRLHPTRAVLR